MRILDRKTLSGFLQSRLAEQEIIGPVVIEGRLYFQPLDPAKRLSELAWPAGAPGPVPGAEDPLAVNSVKEFFFPRRQELYEHRPEGFISRGAEEKRLRLLVFPRPCDVRGLIVLDRVFLGEPEDESYGNARRNTTIVGLHCLQPDRHCFCTSLDGGPFHSEGMDLALTPLDGRHFLAEAVTKKGEALLTEMGGKQAEEPEREAAAELRERAAVRRRIEVPVPGAMVERFDSPYWGEVSRACITCGVCTYLCPTCHCFDIVDEGYLRLRCWDTCSSDTFTCTAAGEDHRRHKLSRYRQRIYHKFSYFKENFGIHSCVGCGRCARYCPVKIDLVEILDGIGEAPAAARTVAPQRERAR